MFRFLSRLFAASAAWPTASTPWPKTTDAVNGKLRERLALDGPAPAPARDRAPRRRRTGRRPQAKPQRQGPHPGRRVLTRPLLGDAKRRPKGRPGRAPRPSRPVSAPLTARVRPTCNDAETPFQAPPLPPPPRRAPMKPRRWADGRTVRCSRPSTTSASSPPTPWTPTRRTVRTRACVCAGRGRATLARRALRATHPPQGGLNHDPDSEEEPVSPHHPFRMRT